MHTIEEMIQTFRGARNTGTPIVWITTPDPASTMTRLTAANPFGDHVAVFDLAAGLKPLNDTTPLAATASGVPDPIAALDWIRTAPDESLLFINGAHAIFLTDSGSSRPIEVMTLWHLRDALKANFRMVVCLAPTDRVPMELRHDVMVLDEPLPTEADLAALVDRTYAAAELPTPPADFRERCVDALIGLPMFPAEQVAALSVRKAAKGIDLRILHERRIKAIESASPGLKVWRGGETANDIGGCAGILDFLVRLRDGKRRPRVVVWLDEVEKQMAGIGGDTSGTSHDQLGALLGYMQDHDAGGLMFVGHPGTSKSLVAKAAASILDTLCIALDLGALKGSLVGESERQMRDALKVITSISQGRALFVATSNGIANLPPEFRRRFRLGTYFFDLPTADEREAIWKVYERKFNLHEIAGGTTRPNDEGWTGAEIAQCADFADRFGASLPEAAGDIVPISVSAVERIAKLRAEADGRYRSAAGPGLYRAPNAVTGATTAPAKRRMRSED